MGRDLYEDFCNLQLENEELKNLLRWQTTRADKYLEFIQDLGLKIETTSDHLEPWATEWETEPIFITREIIETTRLAIGYRGIKDHLLERIEELTAIRG